MIATRAWATAKELDSSGSAFAVVASVLRLPLLEPLKNIVSFTVLGRTQRVEGVEGSFLAFGDILLGASYSGRINDLESEGFPWRCNENRARSSGAI
jgi:hypothetical protein